MLVNDSVVANKFQNVNFNSIQEFLDFLPEDELKLVNYLRHIVFECAPFITEKLSYNVPYYSNNNSICYIWPSSIKWGKKERNGVQFGFQKGHLMRDEIHYLEHGQRKQVFTKTFYSIDDIDEFILKAYIFEALEIDKNL